ncbi:XkdX family protein [Paraclostridium bifermentans]|uniref:XkdX family protein n=1 Tax=Paraclostridium bifermentans TaxID=1490 RepID=UPI00359C5BEA
MNDFWYNTIKRYFEMGFYTDDDMRVFVQAEKITVEQFEEIVGSNYENSTELKPKTIKKDII